MLALLVLVSSGGLDKPGMHLGLCPGARRELSSSRGGYQGTPRPLSHPGVCDVFHRDVEIWNVPPLTSHRLSSGDFPHLSRRGDIRTQAHIFFKIRKRTERQVSFLFCLFSFYICKAQWKQCFFIEGRGFWHRLLGIKSQVPEDANLVPLSRRQRWVTRPFKMPTPLV